MTTRNSQQFILIIMIMYAAFTGASTENGFNHIFLRLYVGTTVEKYIDYSLENITAITSQIYSNKPTVIIIHGFTENVEEESVRIIVQAYLQRKDHNIIAGDYGELAYESYVSLVMNASRIADIFATYLNEMKKSGFNTETLHIVSHSLGSQIAGYIGRKVSFPIPRITGLDPAGPLFNYLQPHLSSSDARFVDIIHTDHGFYGNIRISGTVDFFPNGGKRIQPGCPQHPIFFGEDDFCSHHRSWIFYAESVNDESAYVGVQCSSLSYFNSGKCENNTQTIMGYGTPNTAQGTFYLQTNDHSPFGLKEQGFPSKKIDDSMLKNCNVQAIPQNIL